MGNSLTSILPESSGILKCQQLEFNAHITHDFQYLMMPFIYELSGFALLAKYNQRAAIKNGLIGTSYISSSSPLHIDDMRATVHIALQYGICCLWFEGDGWFCKG